MFKWHSKLYKGLASQYRGTRQRASVELSAGFLHTMAIIRLCISDLEVSCLWIVGEMFYVYCEVEHAILNIIFFYI